MAVKKKLPEPTTAVVEAASVLPPMVGASAEVQERMNEVAANLESVESFQLPRVKMRATGMELIEGQELLTELVGTMIHTKKTNIFYLKPYNPNEITAPDCFSKDGVMPDSSIAKPQHATCKGCPKAEFGTNSMGSGKACRNIKPVFMLLGDAIMPRQLNVAPSSLKAANQYLMDLTERGISYRKVVTKVTAYKANPADTYMTLKFSVAGKLDEQGMKNAEFLRNTWLPIMNNQVADRNEFDGAQAVKPAAVDTGEY